MTNDDVKKLYESGWNDEKAPTKDTNTSEWQIWAAGNSDREDDDHQADFPLGLEKRFELYMEWEYEG